MRVDKGRLGRMTEIARGAAGTVYRLDAPNLPGLTMPLAYKDAHATLGPAERQQIIRSMESAVAIRDAMSAADQDLLDRYATWPLATVEEHGATAGVVMPLIPADFFVTARPLGAGPSQKVFEFAYLSGTDTYMQKLGIDRSGVDDPLVRLSLVAQLAFAIGLLHKHSIVYGDLSLKNLAVAANPPRLKLLDCDATAALSDPARKQMHSPFFKPPEIENKSQTLQDRETDVYKLGLCILRGLLKGPGVTQLMNARALKTTLDQAGVDLIDRAVSEHRGRRPTAREICLYLEQTVLARAHPPVVRHADLHQSAVPRGSDVVVSWAADGATGVRILAPNGRVHVVDKTDAHPRGYSITPEGSGDVVVEVTNRYGSDTVVAGFVNLYDLPPFDLPALPIPEVAALAPVHVPAALSALPPRPVVTVASHPVPRLDAPDLSPLLTAIGPALPGDTFLAPARHTGQQLRQAHRQAGEQVADLITDTLAAALTAARQATPTNKESRPA